VTVVDNKAVLSSDRVPEASWVAPALFATTLCTSAFLLFVIQPMFTKMVLPLLGGAPTVWSVALVFFQVTLLGGYAYAHLLVRYIPLGIGALLHFGTLAAAAAMLPIGVAIGFGLPPMDNIAFWLIGLLAVSIGLPFAALSTTAPLLQRWFSASGHARASNPYVFYAASNLGSFAALFAYPTLIEPFLPLHTQARTWSVGFGAFILLLAAAALVVTRWTSRPITAATAASVVSSGDRLRWVALAAIPAGLVIAVTSYVSTDLASVPFLWVLPLAAYLLTFVGTFRDRPWISHATVARLVPFAVVPLSVGLLGGQRAFWLVLVLINLVAFVLLAMLCHRELYRRRPAPARLTEFYLWTSLGGALGGMFAAIVAPHVFAQVYEYPILILAALLALPGVFHRNAGRLMAQVGPVLIVVVLAVAARFWFGLKLPARAELAFQIVLIALAALMFLQRERLPRFIALVALGFLLTGLWQPGFNRVAMLRSFFGVNQIIETTDGQYRLLYHGTTLHGAERIAEVTANTAPEPLTYFYRGGPISDGIEAVRKQRGSLGRVAIVGLGTGALACYQRPGEQWTFYEIDSAVVQIARDPKFFTFVSDCAPDLPIVIGDARLTLTASAQTYDLIVLDAFSSDAIPVHLMTREAMQVYRRHLNPGGAILMHISNRYMELADVAAAGAAAEGLTAFIKLDDRPQTSPPDYKMNAEVVALAKSPQDLGDLSNHPGWHELRADKDVRAWTDDYSNILGAIIRKQAERWHPPAWAQQGVAP
jgi:SAM-dependent methyltransferase